MARYKTIDMSPRFLPVVLDAQLVPGTFAHALHHLVDGLDLSAFDGHFRNDKNGAPAHAPRMLLKAVLLGYSQGLVSSRAIERSCRENVLFIAITGDAKPHFTTIADFVSRSRDAIAAVFGQVLAVLDSEGLIGREMFAIDGVKLPSNASKHRSGTRAEFAERADKLERKIKAILDQHRGNDVQGREGGIDSAAAARIERMQRRASELREWLAKHPRDRQGPTGGVRKSNLTDNESAKMATDKGVIQGFCGIAAVDGKQQVIVEASAHGTGAEQDLLLPVIDACSAHAGPLTVFTADAGFHSENNLQGLADRGVEALIADNGMRQRDERFGDRAKHQAKPDPLHDKSARKSRSGLFVSSDFRIADDLSHAVCPAGQSLHRNGKACTVGVYRAVKFRAPVSACANCALRAQCLRKPETTPARQLAILTRRHTASHTKRMRERIDSVEGRATYSMRMATVEPVFANLRHNKRLNRFTLRGQSKVDGQWKLFALVHNIEKLMNYRKAA